GLFSLRRNQVAVVGSTTPIVWVPLPSQSPTAGRQPGRPKTKPKSNGPALLLLRRNQLPEVGSNVPMVLRRKPCTVWAAEVLVAKVLTPGLYTAVKELLPGLTPRVVKAAWPLVRGTVPRAVLPLRKVTVPGGVGAPGPVPATVAVSVTGCVVATGAVADTASGVGGGSTPCTIWGAEVLMAK